jgi:hypothetical protein
MNRPGLVRKIYAELRSVADADASAAELLRTASAIAEAYDSTTGKRDPGLTYHTGGIPFDRWALDRAMADGGWRIFRYESELAQSDFDDQSCSEAIAIKEWMMENAA